MSCTIPRKCDLQLQSNIYTCGPATLRHAFLAYGMRTSIRRLAKLSGTDVDGTSPEGLDKAARFYGYKLPYVRRATAKLAKETVRNFLRAGAPVLVPIERWRHWAVAVYALRDQVLILDSQGVDPKAIRRSMTWRDFYTELGVCRGPREQKFDLYPLVPECVSV